MPNSRDPPASTSKAGSDMRTPVIAVLLGTDTRPVWGLLATNPAPVSVRIYAKEIEWRVTEHIPSVLLWPLYICTQMQASAHIHAHALHSQLSPPPTKTSGQQDGSEGKVPDTEYDS